MTFRGFPADALDFFFELEANNERSWWQANKQRFETSVATPMRELLDTLEPEFGAFKVFRMNRDVRFSADKSPYKTAHAAVTQQDGTNRYVQISATGLFAGGGMYHMARDQLERFRDAVGDDRSGGELETAIASARRARLDIGGVEPPLRPRRRLAERPSAGRAAADEGVDHTPRPRHTGVAAHAAGSDEVAKVWRRGAGVSNWLDANVGPSDEPAPRR